MILLDKPFISDFLINTLERNQFPVVATPTARELVSDKNLNFISEAEAVAQYRANPNQPVYTNSENSISWVEQHLSFSSLPSRLKLFKNKVQFRDLLQEEYPNYFYKSVAFQELDQLDVETLPFPFIIKPAVGFFSMGVHRVDQPSEW
ncbi:MAG: ATP-grasp domain-containing protein [Hymenobacteraceae bacterium]|nr:ATP-grasp domain-containing protein [Hymenobacteraceae bacterium]